MVPNVGTLTKSELLSRYYELLCKKFFQSVQTDGQQNFKGNLHFPFFRIG
ncbi:hypothetical protein LEP1GSC040_3966 [Leptospira santarosai str. 2000030832]|nr:hypothetical protein LEP1GSC040_3966 [Leptospira santarosai str. 2000030832]